MAGAGLNTYSHHCKVAPSSHGIILPPLMGGMVMGGEGYIHEYKARPSLAGGHLPSFPTCTASSPPSFPFLHLGECHQWCRRENSIIRQAWQQVNCVSPGN